jgi:hypothetical protein
MVPGLYGSRLVLTIDCDNFLKNKENESNLRLFCGKTICKGKKAIEEHVLWPSLFDGPFKLVRDKSNKYTSCTGYFYQFYNKQSDCPEISKIDPLLEFLGEKKSKNQKSFSCKVDPSVKVTFYGGTQKTSSDSECGVRGIRNVVSANSLIEGLVNEGAPKSYQMMQKRFKEMGYRAGFSMGGLPFDFRRFTSKNFSFMESFKFQINNLYENTGRPVVVIGHSFGNHNILNMIYKDDPIFLSKIKRFIAIAPGLGGVSKIVDAGIYGNFDFNQIKQILGRTILNIGMDFYGQSMSDPFNGAFYDLRPNSYLFDLLKSDKYLPVYEAIKERSNLENKCGYEDCDQEYIKQNSKKFDALFVNLLPSYSDEECKLSSWYERPQFKEAAESYINTKDKEIIKLPSYNPFPCKFGFFNNNLCPILTDRKDLENNLFYEKQMCKEDEYLKEVYAQSCNESNKDRCLDNFMIQGFKYPYSPTDEKLQYLVNQFKLNYKLDLPQMDTEEEFYEKVKRMISYHSEESTVKDAPLPLVNTTIIYGTSLLTPTAFLYDKKANISDFNSLKDVFYKGGDDSVPTYSSFLVGLKWIYDSKLQNSTKSVQFVEYCSSLSKYGNSVRSNNLKDLDQSYLTIPCSCLTEEGAPIKNTNLKKCGHSQMINDSPLISFVEQYLYTNNDKTTKSFMNALNKYDKNVDYLDQCNQGLVKIADF